jgi:hypothetical protein
MFLDPCFPAGHIAGAWITQKSAWRWIFWSTSFNLMCGTGSRDVPSMCLFLSFLTILIIITLASLLTMISIYQSKRPPPPTDHLCYPWLFYPWPFVLLSLSIRFNVTLQGNTRNLNFTHLMRYVHIPSWSRHIEEGETIVYTPNPAIQL